MDTKSNLSNRVKINELAISHNKLTTLVACLLNEVNSLKKELTGLKSGNTELSPQSQSQSQTRNSASNAKQNMNSKYPNFSELNAEDILKQLSINN